MGRELQVGSGCGSRRLWPRFSSVTPCRCDKVTFFSFFWKEPLGGEWPTLPLSIIWGMLSLDIRAPVPGSFWFGLYVVGCVLRTHRPMASTLPDHTVPSPEETLGRPAPGLVLTHLWGDWGPASPCSSPMAEPGRGLVSRGYVLSGQVLFCEGGALSNCSVLSSACAN